MCSLSKATWTGWSSVLLFLMIMGLSHSVQAGNGTCPIHLGCEMVMNDDGTSFCPLCVCLEAERKESKERRKTFSLLPVVVPPVGSNSDYAVPHHTILSHPSGSSEIVISPATGQNREKTEGQLLPNGFFLSSHGIGPSQPGSSICCCQGNNGLGLGLQSSRVLVNVLTKMKKSMSMQNLFQGIAQLLGNITLIPGTIPIRKEVQAELHTLRLITNRDLLSTRFRSSVRFHPHEVVISELIATVTNVVAQVISPEGDIYLLHFCKDPDTNYFSININNVFNTPSFSADSLDDFVENFLIHFSGWQVNVISILEPDSCGEPPMLSNPVVASDDTGVPVGSGQPSTEHGLIADYINHNIPVSCARAWRSPLEWQANLLEATSGTELENAVSMLNMITHGSVEQADDVHPLVLEGNAVFFWIPGTCHNQVIHIQAANQHQCMISVQNRMFQVSITEAMEMVKWLIYKFGDAMIIYLLPPIYE